LLLQEQLVGVAMGLVAGGVGAWWAVETVRRQLYGVAATDPVIWSLTALAILVSASLATLVPAIRAALADPAQTLRADG